jgi:hypothetical protein
MHHIGTVSKSTRIPNLDFNAQCSCGTAGHFAEKQQAVQYLEAHFRKQSGVSTSELIDATMPKAVAAAVKPPAPPAPPSAAKPATAPAKK